MPITSLPDLLQSKSSQGSSSFYLLRTGRTRQPSPKTVPTRYRWIHCWIDDAKLLGGLTWAQASFCNVTEDVSPWQLCAGKTFHGSPWSGGLAAGPGSPYAFEAVNLARAKFMDELSDRSEWLVNLAERKQAVDMISNRARKLLSFCSQLKNAYKKGRPSVVITRRLLRTLGRTIAPRSFHGRPVSRDAAGAFLELHFGWEPLVKDIYNAVQLLQQPIKSSRIRARGRPVPITSQYEDSTSHASVSGKCVGFMSAQVEITNPNLWLANNLGLVNPATLVWELIPFSFVVDWFVNVGDFLHQYTDFLGAELKHASYGWKTQVTHVVRQQENWYPMPGTICTSQGRYYCRETGIPGVTLGFRSFRGISVTRGATAISLLIQQGIKPLARKS